MADLRIEELSARTVVAANNLSLRPGQEQFVVPVSHSIAEAYVNPDTAWPRVILDGDEVVGFLMGNFDPDSEQEEFRSCIWRLNVSADAQRRGVGRFAVQVLADEARRRGFERLTVMWEPGEDSPEEFFLHMGFAPVGESEYGEVIGALALG